MHSLDERIGAALARFVAVVDRRPGPVLALLGLLTLGLSAYAATHLGVNSSPDAMVSEDLPFRVNERRFWQTFRDNPKAP